MLNNKRIGIASLILLSVCSIVLSGCKTKDKDSIISSELIDEENITVGKSEVEKGTFTNTVTVSAEKIFMKTAELAFPFDGVELEAVYVKTGDSVKEGDLVAKIKTPTSEDLEKYARDIQDQKSCFQNVLASFESRIQEKKSEAASTSGAQKEIAEAEAARLQIEREQYEYTMNKSIAEMNAEYENLKNVEGKDCVYAPFDGIVETAVVAGDGNYIDKEYIVAKICSTDEIMFSFKNDKKFRFGMDVTIEAGVGDKRQSFKGRVVAADNIMFEDYHTNKAYVIATEEFNPKNLQNIYISGEIMHLDNVLVVDALTVMPEQDKFGVSIALEEGSKYRHITLGDIADGKAWILQGVSEGQMLTIE